MDRRSKSDVWIWSARVSALVCWLSLFIFQWLAWVSKPEMDTGLVRYHHIEIRTSWLPEWLDLMGILLVVAIASTMITFAIHPWRGRRQGDSSVAFLWIQVILIGACTTVYLMRP